MTEAELLECVDDAFSDAARPAMFIRGSCRCEECVEHEERMQSFDPLRLSLEHLGNPGWDPICFASNDAWCYLMPGLLRLLLAETDAYISQFSFHLSQPERLQCLTPGRAEALTHVIDWLLLNRPKEVDDNAEVDLLLHVRASLEPAVGSG